MVKQSSLFQETDTDSLHIVKIASISHIVKHNHQTFCNATYKKHNLIRYPTYIWSYEIKYDYYMTEQFVKAFRG